ncbi:hypothetical protein [Gilvimarinus algae]|uniref:2TM domain-containing protein n=1 Tax=Gilvimarinus algae TaxID=3058037 RepID=A0ABT8THI8_9GAMM|nr:hypothetical protein [Gilvimarinus sp. SDUM040014]MDO3383050.1 hypothetical protein [Gilvimarinus sp. SDUM040014]
MGSQREVRQFPQLQGLPEPEQQRRLTEAKARAFGTDHKLERWRGNLLHFGIMFAVSAVFMAWLAPLLSLTRDTAALIMLLIVLPTFFYFQHKRYQRLISKALNELPENQR